MNILDIGIDIVEIKRIEDALNKNKRFLDKLFTKEEIKYFESRNFNFIDIEVLRNELGKPIVKTYNNLNKMCIDYNVLEIKVSISHSDNYAVSNAIAIVKE